MKPKAVIAAAGMGSRFLPWTKAMPKEMLPLGNKPVLQHIVEGLVDAGVEQIAIVGGPQKRAIENHFDPAPDLEQNMRDKGKDHYADEIKKVSELAHFIYIGQYGEPLGNARPLLNAVDTGFLSENQEEPFFYMFADDFFASDMPHPVQLLEAYKKHKKSVISLIEIDDAGKDKYGIADPGKQLDEKCTEVKGLVEKPGVEKAPSNFAAVSGYLLDPAIIKLARKLKVSPRGEIELPSAINELAAQGKVVGANIEGTYHDAGNPASYAMAVIDYALNDASISEQVLEYLRNRLQDNER